MGSDGTDVFTWLHPTIAGGPLFGGLSGCFGGPSEPANPRPPGAFGQDAVDGKIPAHVVIVEQ
jgi:hypothetical protein